MWAIVLKMFNNGMQRARIGEENNIKIDLRNRMGSMDYGVWSMDWMYWVLIKDHWKVLKII
jgi:hypothetical protein